MGVELQRIRVAWKINFYTVRLWDERERERDNRLRTRRDSGARSEVLKISEDIGTEDGRKNAIIRNPQTLAKMDRFL